MLLIKCTECGGIWASDRQPCKSKVQFTFNYEIPTSQRHLNISLKYKNN